MAELPPFPALAGSRYPPSSPYVCPTCNRPFDGNGRPPNFPPPNPTPDFIGFQPVPPEEPESSPVVDLPPPYGLNPSFKDYRSNSNSSCSSSCDGCDNHGCRKFNNVGIEPANYAYYWVDSSSGSHMPSTALLGGHDIDGTQIYVGRAFHEGDWLPAKVIPEKQVAYVAYHGGEHAKHQYQVLCEQRFDWVPTSDGHVPPGAVEGGRTADGEALYIGRVHHDGAITVGKVHPSHGVCYVPFDGNEDGHDSYEVLVLRA